MTDDIQRNSLARDIQMRLLRADLELVRLIDRALTRAEQLRALSWSRHVRSGDTRAHLVSLSGGSMVTRCNGRWPVGDTVQTWIDGPPLRVMCPACAERWARGKDVQLYGLLELARDLATEDLEREALREAARLEMTGGAT